MMEPGAEVTCPFCVAIAGSCHACAGRRTILFGEALRLAPTVNRPRPGCACDACRVVAAGQRSASASSSGRAAAGAAGGPGYNAKRPAG